MTNTTTRDVIARLASPEESGLDLAVLIPLLRLLASGDPVDVAALALASAPPIDEVRRRLDSVPARHEAKATARPRPRRQIASPSETTPSATGAHSTYRSRSGLDRRPSLPRPYCYSRVDCRA